MTLYLKCDQCNHERIFKTIIRLYDHPAEICVIPWPCWCNACSDVSLGEHIPSVRQIEEELAAFCRKDQGFDYQITAGPISPDDEGVMSSVSRHYEVMIDWRRQRKSPGRCLLCGSVEIELSGGRLDNVGHPRCGTFKCLVSVTGSIALRTLQVFSTEGIKQSERKVIA